MSLEGGIKVTRRKLKRLGTVVGKGRSVLVTSHNNPDPDSVAASLLLKLLLTRKYDARVTLAYGGVIGRAENVALLDYTGADFVHSRRAPVGEFDTVALVDTQPGTGNHPFGKVDKIGIVIDHHRLRSETRSAPFYDVRTRFGATTTMLYTYLRAARIPVTRRLATMILYALRTETSDMGREASKADREVYKLCYAAADLRALAAILHAKVNKGYFTAVQEGIKNSYLYGSLIVTHLGELPYPDVASEIAEYFLRYKGADHSFAVGRYRDEILFSIRSDGVEEHLGHVARSMVAEIGSAGGHGTSAGGQISVTDKTPDEIEAIERALVERLLAALGMEGRRRTKFVEAAA